MLCFDVSDFFGSLNHKLLKARLKNLLGQNELTQDWYNIFRYITKYSWVDLDDLRRHPALQDRFKKQSIAPFATVAELRRMDIRINSNKNHRGIPQGTPISATLANLYMIQFDEVLHSWASGHGCLYRRYSDDILIVCPPDLAKEAEHIAVEQLTQEKLEANNEKTERWLFGHNLGNEPQYLGFTLSSNGVSIRASSLSRQWRKLRRSLRHTRRDGLAAIEKGTANTIYTKKLRRRFSALPATNFSAYARRSAAKLESPRIIRQIRRLERFADREITALKRLSAPHGDNSTGAGG